MANKASRTIQEQIELLENRGMMFRDKAFAMECLKRISYSRLWSRNMVKRPSEPLNPHNTWLSRQLSDMEAKRPFYIITAMLYLCDAVNPRNRLREDIFQLMKKYSHLPIQRMGFFAGWEQEPIWATISLNSPNSLYTKKSCNFLQSYKKTS
ncbi:MAG: hypothetical protein IJ185_03460 [Prevotella sp.]|nr:hypothetical protein [Prevotella sp.]